MIQPNPEPLIHGSHPHPTSACLAVDYVHQDLAELLAADDTLAVFGFGDAAPCHDDPRYLRVGLQPLRKAPLEVWRASPGVQCGREGDVAWAEDGALQFGAIEIDEPAGEDIGAAAETAYRELLAFTARRGYPHLLRIWNYLDAITDGDGDGERYRRFCVGRATGLGDFDATQLPAATAVGRVDGQRRLQVYWLAAKTPGTAVENPRQISAWRYPRRYGLRSPSFARAMLPSPGSTMPLLLSGTAAIVGHESRHADAIETQLDETLANFDSLIGAARRLRPGVPTSFGAGSHLKVYVRDPAELNHMAAMLEQRLASDVPRIILHATICRRELRMEIDGTHDL
ncbi:chorismate transformation enzyme, FkbO/Hyg5 family [Lysobacter sp. A289]